jgi:menaquinone-dependent protoporphyrinogen oxidase
VVELETLIVYGTRYGASASAAQEIAEVLRGEGFSVKVADVKKEKIKDISPYQLVVVGSGMQMGKWTGEAEDFLKKHQKEFAAKKLAIFASTMKMVPQKEGKPEEVEKIRKAAIDEKIVKYNLQPIAVGFFGGILNFGKMNMLFRRTFGMIRPQLESDGFKESEPGVYDLRDPQEIPNWAKELSQKAREA